MVEAVLTFRQYAARVALFIAMAALAFFVVRLAPVLLMAFGGIVFAIALRRIAARLAERLPLGERAWVGILLVTLLVLIAVGGMLFGQQLGDQFEQLSSTLRDSYERLQEWVKRHGLHLGFQNLEQSLLSWVTGVGSALWQVVSGALLIFFTMIFLSINPKNYREGLIALFPPAKHDRVDSILAEIETALWRWTIGQLFAMVVIGVLTAVVLSLLGVPLALLLGLIAGLLEFIPVIGPVVAAVPAVMVAGSESMTLALWALAAYVGIQQVESWIVTPLVERWAVALPPAVTVLAVAGFGLLFGLPGLLFATPLALVLMVLIRIVYVRDTLGGDLSKSAMPP